MFQCALAIPHGPKGPAGLTSTTVRSGMLAAGCNGVSALRMLPFL